MNPMAAEAVHVWCSLFVQLRLLICCCVSNKGHLRLERCSSLMQRSVWHALKSGGLHAMYRVMHAEKLQMYSSSKRMPANRMAAD